MESGPIIYSTTQTFTRSLPLATVRFKETGRALLKNWVLVWGAGAGTLIPGLYLLPISEGRIILLYNFKQKLVLKADLERGALLR